MKNYGAYIETSFGTNKSSSVIRSTCLIDQNGAIRYHWPEMISEGHVERAKKNRGNTKRNKLNTVFYC